MNAYLIIDIGTGNLRVAVCKESGEILAIDRTDIRYYNDDKYADAQYFKPDELWKSILRLSKNALFEARKANPGLEIIACTTTSQREGIVLLDKEKNDIIGMPNHDHRGRIWEDTVENPDEVYRKTGRKVSSLFSALKVRGFLEKYPEHKESLSKFTSISDWAAYRLTGNLVYEHSQASETNLYDVQNKQWDASLCTLFGLEPAILPPLAYAGSTLGTISEEIKLQLDIKKDVPVFVGGADTQMAINSTAPRLDDLVIVAGTTTPIVKVKDAYLLDDYQRTWTNSHLHDGQYILEVNAGVTGLNIQRLKQIFYPNEGYEVMESELKSLERRGSSSTSASLGSLVCSEKKPLTVGGFVFKAPINHELTRADLVMSAIVDMVFCIKGNLDVLLEVDNSERDFLWICGGGAQGGVFLQLLADVLRMNLRIRDGFRQASVSGAVNLCREALGNHLSKGDESYNEVKWREDPGLPALYEDWYQTRQHFKNRKVHA